MLQIPSKITYLTRLNVFFTRKNEAVQKSFYENTLFRQLHYPIKSSKKPIDCSFVSCTDPFLVSDIQ